jgi:hypothetical protein
MLPPWLTRLAPTVIRCHMIGSTTAVALIVCTAWVCSLNQIKVATIEYEGMKIDLNDASTLIENADQWRRLYTANYEIKRAVDQHVEQISAWLPRSVDWSVTQSDIHLIAQAADVSILSLERGDDHAGTRVGVVLANCDAEGSYVSICRFLNSLGQLPNPIACSEIHLQRTKDETVGASGAKIPLCQATLYLRIPFAAGSTAAGRLLPAETKNAG